MAIADQWADISHHQTRVDLAAYAAAGHRTIAIKATGGAVSGALRYVDEMFPMRWQHAGRLGLHRIAYHFARNGNDGVAEWEWFSEQLRAAGGLKPGDVVCYDQEDTRTPAMQTLAVQRTREFIGAAVAAGVEVGWIYSGRWYIEPAGLLPQHVPAGWRHLWLSDYTVGQPDTEIEVPHGWSRDHIVARQWSDRATVAGIGTPCDANRTVRWSFGEPTPPPELPILEAEMFVAMRGNTAFLVRPYGSVPLGPTALAAFRRVLDVEEFDAEEITAMRSALGMSGLGDALQHALGQLAESVNTLAGQVRSIGAAVDAIRRTPPADVAIDTAAVSAAVAEQIQRRILAGLTARIEFGARDGD